MAALALSSLVSSDWVRSHGLHGLHVGCRDELAPCWLNTDISPPAVPLTGPELTALPNGGYFLRHDATKPFPIGDEAFELIYSEHFIEHLTLADGVTWLKEMRRLLAVGGVLRISTPDLKKYVEGYLDPEDTFFRAHRDRLETANVGVPRRKAWMMNQIFRQFGHRWIYDFEEIVYAATRAGFSPERVIRREYRVAHSPALADMDRELRRDESLYVELTR